MASILNYLNKQPDLTGLNFKTDPHAGQVISTTPIIPNEQIYQTTPATVPGLTDWLNPQKKVVPVSNPVVTPTVTPTNSYTSGVVGTDGAGVNTSGQNLTAGQIAQQTPANIGLGYIPGETADAKASREFEENRMKELDAEATPETEDQRRTRITNDFQGEIDALNAVYARQRQEAIQTGMGNLGSESAIQSRRGLLGSTFGEGSFKGVEGENQQMLNKVDEAKNLAMSAVYSKIRAEVSQSKKDKDAARKASSDAHLAYLKAVPEKKQAIATSTIQAIINAKATPTDKDFQDMAAQIGIDPVTFKNEYELALKTQSDTETKKKQDADKIKSELETEAVARLKDGIAVTEPIVKGDRLYQYDMKLKDWKDIGPATTKVEKFGDLTPADQSKGINYLIKSKATAEDIEKFKTDRAFQAWVLNKVNE